MRLFSSADEHGDVRVAAQAEHVLDAARFEVLHQLVRDQVLHVFSSAPRMAATLKIQRRAPAVAAGVVGPGCAIGRRHVAPRRPAVAIGNVARHRAHDPAAALLLLPCVREDADRARQDEQTAAELRLEAELAEDHRGDAVDVHRDVALLARTERLLHRASDARPAPRHGALGFGFRNELEQRRRARIDRMKAMAEPGNDLLARFPVPLDDARRRLHQIAVGTRLGVDLAIELHALLARAAVDVVEHVDRGGHRAVHRQTARHRHPRDRDRRRVRPVVDAGHERRLEQVRLRRRRQFAAQHQPDHLGKAHAADQLLDRIAADRDLARVDVDDRRVPPRARFGEQLVRRLRRHGSGARVTS